MKILVYGDLMFRMVFGRFSVLIVWWNRKSLLIKSRVYVVEKRIGYFG